MDSLSQIVLGASVGAAVMARHGKGRQGALIGAICGTIPDMDVFIPMADDVSRFTYHRGFSHSFIFSIFMTPIMVWLFSLIPWFKINVQQRYAYGAIFLSLVTHPILDAFTIYGTQLFWPLATPPVGLGSIFIIDPLYTIPFLICLIIYLCTQSQKVVYVGLMASTLYLLWSAGAQYHVKQMVVAQIGDVPARNILVQATAFNTILWRVVVMNDDQTGYRVGYHSFFDKSDDIDFVAYGSDSDALGSSSIDDVAMKRLQWFTKGFYGVRVEGRDVILVDLRMGAEPDIYVFQFILNDYTNRRYVRPEGRPMFDGVWDRMMRDVDWFNKE